MTSSAECLFSLQVAYEKERAAAKGLVVELMRHPPERRRVLICNHPRFQTWGVFESLVELGWQESLPDPALGEEMAKLSLDLSDHLDASIYGAEAIEDLRARAWAYIGNARRMRADFPTATEAFCTALHHLRQGTREPWEKALWLDLKASLLRAQRRLPEALRLLRRSLALFLAVGDRHRAGRSLISMDYVLHHAGRPEEGIPLLYRALDLIDPEQEPQLLLMAWHNLIDDLAESGRYMESQRLLIQARDLYRKFDEPWVRNRRIWVEAKIARGLGQQERAERLLSNARTAFRDLGAAYEMALVSLELAGLYAEDGKTAEIKVLADEMVPIFSSRQIRREGLAALVLWHQAVQSETAGVELAAQVAATIKRGRYDQPLTGQETL